VCARVKIEIEQELTLERQAFDAHMRINNGLSNIGLEDVDIDVSFSDASGNTVRATTDPDDATALFFIRLDSMENINAVDGTGRVGPSTSADIHWLIIPALGASDGVEAGTLYYVGATLTYTIGGEEHETTVTPDYIFVKPMPELTLDYFLTQDVFGDDAFTQEIEPSVPFTLGVRVHNGGEGTAGELKIDSAQPRIVENEQGLLINFVIEGSEVNGKEATRSLLADFGDIAPGTSGVARWIMTCTLSGRFEEFTAAFTHSDELGGELTSLIGAVNTHFLVRDVLVDLSGRDSVRDFLAKDGDVYRVYESDSVDTVVVDQSGASHLTAAATGSGTAYTLTVPVTSGFMFVQLPDPFGGEMELRDVVRSDGKQIKSYNAWLSKARASDKQSWEYFVNVFDANTTTAYTLVFGSLSEGAQPPELQFIPDHSTVEGRQLSFLVTASDPNGTVPALSAAPLPVGASFVDRGDGTGTLDWTPAAGQAGSYSIVFTASDGVLSDSQSAVIHVYANVDGDGDGMPDDWETSHFQTLERDGTGDFDGDGVTDLEEYLNDTDPTTTNAPAAPVILAPEDGAEVNVQTPDLTIARSIDPDPEDVVWYEFEVYTDASMTRRVAGEAGVMGSGDVISWSPSEALADNALFYWRVRASDGKGYSSWAYGEFFVNTQNDVPGPFQISRPLDGSDVGTLTPALEVSNSTDVDGDALSYTFEVYGDGSLSSLVASGSVSEGEEGKTSWSLIDPLSDNTWYFWRVQAVDEHGAASVWTETISFFVNTANDAPDAPGIESPEPGAEVQEQSLDLVVSNAQDLDRDALEYFFECDSVNTFDGASKQASGAVSEGEERTLWSISGLADNTLYYWRVQASDGAAQSRWTVGSFFVNTANDPPSTPTERNPGHGAWVSTLTPTLEVQAATDADRDGVGYVFELYADSTLTQLLYQEASPVAQWTVPSELLDNTWYFWRVQAVDEHGAASVWTETISFFVNNNAIDDPPTINLIQPSQSILTNAEAITIEWQDADPDSNASISLYWDADESEQDGTLIEAGLQEDADGEADLYAWDASAMPDGTYYIYAIIEDATSSLVSYAPGAVTLDRTTPTVAASPAGGDYGAAQTVTLAADESAVLYYTLDGLEPTIASTVYTGPITVSATTTIKFMAVDGAGNESPVATETYIIDPEEPIDMSVIGVGYYFISGRMALFTAAAVQEKGYRFGLVLFNYYGGSGRCNLVSTSIDAMYVTDSGAVQIEGKCTVNGSGGYTFTAILADRGSSGKDLFGIEVLDKTGKVVFSSSLAPIAGGSITAGID
jgi:hypothetical protein